MEKMLGFYGGLYLGEHLAGRHGVRVVKVHVHHGPRHLEAFLDDVLIETEGTGAWDDRPAGLDARV